MPDATNQGSSRWWRLISWGTAREQQPEGEPVHEPDNQERSILRHPLFITIVGVVLVPLAVFIYSYIIDSLKPPPPLVLYSLYRPEGGEPVFVMAPAVDPDIPKDYEPIKPLGYGYPPATQDSDTHLIFDNFCRRADHKCDGLVRTHFYTTSDLPVYQEGWNPPKKVARFFNVNDDQSCDDDQVVMFRFRAAKGAVMINTIASTEPPGNWELVESLGCLKTPPQLSPTNSGVP